MKNFKYLMLMVLFLAFNKANAQSNTLAINHLLQSYLNVEQALFRSNSQLANKDASGLVNDVAAITPTKLNAKEQKAWTAYGEKVRYNAQHISESKSIDHQREHFAALSDAVYSLIKTFKTHTTVYREFCPMKKQYWLNASKEIQNPYYGKEMPDCGKVTETMTGIASAMTIN